MLDKLTQISDYNNYLRIARESGKFFDGPS